MSTRSHPMPISVSTANAWFLRFSRSSTPSLRLFCFPFAGSSASVFRRWIEVLPEQVEVMAVQLPGRENRLREPCMNEMDEILVKLEPEIERVLDLPFVFFGHSLGALVAFEVLRRLEARGQHRAELFFASGGLAPHTCTVRDEPLRLTSEEILEDLRRISSAHRALLDDPEVLSLMLPMLQADFEMYANYRYRENAPIHTPIVAIRGAADTYITQDSQLEWERHTAARFAFHTIPGSHLFMLDSPEALLSLVNGYLAPILNNYSRIEG